MIKYVKSVEERIREYWTRQSEIKMKPLIEKWRKKYEEEKKKKEPRN